MASAASTRTLSVGNNGGSGDFSGVIANGTNDTLSFIKTGVGTQILSGANLYTGATTISGGVLAVNGSLANTATTVQSGGTLQGIGSIGGSVTIEGGGFLAPGNSIQSLATGTLSFAAASTYAYELQTNLYAGTPNDAGDLTASTGNLDIAAGAILTLNDLGTTALAAGSKLTLISYFGGWTSGELFSYDAGAGLTTLADGATFTLGANQWVFNYDDITGGGLNFAADQVGATHYVTMTVVPEPGAALIGSLGLLALLRRRRS
jgi:fibronectin-binding autotransporter adhesin